MCKAFFKSHATVTSRDVELTKETTSQRITKSWRRPCSDKHRTGKNCNVQITRDQCHKAFFKSHATVTSRDVELTKETTSQRITTSSRRPYSDKHNDKQRTFVSTTHSKHPLCESNVASNSQQLMNMATTAFAVHAVKPQRLMNAATTSFAVNALKLPRPGQNCAELQDIFHCSVEH